MLLTSHLLRINISGLLKDGFFFYCRVICLAMYQVLIVQTSDSCSCHGLSCVVSSVIVNFVLLIFPPHSLVTTYFHYLFPCLVQRLFVCYIFSWLFSSSDLIGTMSALHTFFCLNFLFFLGLHLWDPFLFQMILKCNRIMHHLSHCSSSIYNMTIVYDCTLSLFNK